MLYLLSGKDVLHTKSVFDCIYVHLPLCLVIVKGEERKKADMADRGVVVGE